MRNLWGISKLARREHYKLRGNNASPWAFEFYINNIKRKTKSYFFFTCSMERILERYQQYSYAERALLEADTEVQVAYHQRPASKPQCFIQITKSMWMLYIHRETGALNMGNWRQRLRHYKRVKGTEICVANLVFLLYKDVFPSLWKVSQRCYMHRLFVPFSGTSLVSNSKSWHLKNSNSWNNNLKQLWEK